MHGHAGKDRIRKQMGQAVPTLKSLEDALRVSLGTEFYHLPDDRINEAAKRLAILTKEHRDLTAMRNPRNAGRIERIVAERKEITDALLLEHRKEGLRIEKQLRSE